MQKPTRTASWSLLIDGVPGGLRLRRARTPWRRLIGFWPTPRHHAVDAIEFDRCKAVHTFAMCDSVDVVFVDGEGRVLRVLRKLSPWRFAFDARAHSIYEFRAGVTEGLGIERGSVLTPVTRGLESTATGSIVTQRRQCGSATVEFVLTATLVLLPLVTGILEFSQLAVARQILGQAALDASRSSAINIMDAGGATDTSAEALSIRLSLARGLLPLLGGPDLQADRLASIVLETMRPDRLRVSVERDIVEAADVVIDQIEVTYCRELFFAPASYLLPELMGMWTRDPFERLCLESGRVPLSVSAPATRSRYP